MITLTLTIYIAAQTYTWHGVFENLAACLVVKEALLTSDIYVPLPQGAKKVAECTKAP